MNLLYRSFHLLALPILWLIERVTTWLEPYEEFTRPAEEKYEETLEEKARKFMWHFLHFRLPSGILSYRMPVGDGGDQCLWHGVYTALMSMVYSLNSHLAEVKDQLQACTPGMQLLMSQGFLIRGQREDGSFHEDVSNDQASGYLLGLYFMWKYGDEDSRYYVKILIDKLAQELVSNSYSLINSDGKATKYGKLVNGLLTDPLNLTLCLAILRFAWEATNKLDYLMKYQQLVDRYTLILPYAHFKPLWMGQTSTGMRASIHYSILCDLEKSHYIQRKYLAGLIRTWKMERKSANPFIYFMLRRIVLMDPAELNNVLKHLKEMTVEDKATNEGHDISGNVPTAKWGGIRAKQPSVRWKIRAEDFMDSRHFYSVTDEGDGSTQYNGGDFLFAYFGLKLLHLI